MKRVSILLVMVLLCLSVEAQISKKLNFKKDKTETSDTEETKTPKEKKVLERPNLTGNLIVDVFVEKTFDSFEELQDIQYAVNFVKVNITEVEDKGDGVITEMSITNGRGEAITPKNALKQLTELALRTKIQQENLDAIYKLKVPATNEVGNLPLKQKVQGMKSYKTAVKAEGKLISEIKLLAKVIANQMSTIKSLM